jgi:cysteine-rich repeat protein
VTATPTATSTPPGFPFPTPTPAGVCGNGIVEPGEQCDDSNLINGDGCDANCTITRCGNGIQTAGEVCDDGDQICGDGCDPNCKLSSCGNGYPCAATGEPCDTCLNPGANLPETNLVLKRNATKFSKGGFNVAPFTCKPDHDPTMSGGGSGRGGGFEDPREALAVLEASCCAFHDRNDPEG